MSTIIRAPRQVVVNFANGATTQTEPAVDIGDCSSAAFVVPAEFNGDTLRIKTNVSGDTGFTFVAATGRNNLDSDQAAAFFPMHNMIIETSVATSAAASITVLLKQ